jgi:tRNA-Thr(GGU) m(6)t(6)A37 methyltransferase TsaA
MDTLTPIGTVRSSLKDRLNAPRQSDEGAPAATLEILPAYHEALQGLRPDDDIWILTWLHHAHRGTLRVHPRSDPANPLTGVFATRSPDRPNPIGLHRVIITGITPPGTLHVDHLEAVDGTPILDLKPILCPGR